MSFKKETRRTLELFNATNHREIQIKTIVRYDFISKSMAVMILKTKQIKTSISEYVEPLM